MRAPTTGSRCKTREVIGGEAGSDSRSVLSRNGDTHPCRGGAEYIKTSVNQGLDQKLLNGTVVQATE